MKECEEGDGSYAALIEQSKYEIEICDCINLGYDDYILRQECDEKFFDTEELSEEEIEANDKLIVECIENNEFSIDPTLCECADFSETDEEFKKACDSKFDKKKMKPGELVDYEKAIDLSV